jgi:retron-type reverse transcriptase
MSPVTNKNVFCSLGLRPSDSLYWSLLKEGYKKGSKAFWKDPKNLIESDRPLGLPDFDAKVVQSAINLVLNAIYEPIFDIYNVSFGFRPHRGCHDAIKDIPSQTQGIKIVVQGDIKGAFNNLQHDRLNNILSKWKKLLKHHKKQQ